jgi:hypothetical protein
VATLSTIQHVNNPGFSAPAESSEYGGALPEPPTTEDLTALSLRVEYLRGIVDGRLRRVPRWRGEMRRQVRQYAQPGDAERYARSYATWMNAAAAAPDWSLDTATICRVHDACVGGATFRKTGLRVGGHHNFPSSGEVPALVDKALDRIGRSSETPAVAAARLHLSILRIHPFTDGNGRTARLAASLLLVRNGFRSTLLSAVEEHSHPAPRKYLAVLDRFQYGEIDEDCCVAHLLHAMIANAMYAAWFRARELRLRACCWARGVPPGDVEQTLVAYDLDPSPSHHAAALVEATKDREFPLHAIQQTLTQEQRTELSFQVERLLEEERDEL